MIKKKSFLPKVFVLFVRALIRALVVNCLVKNIALYLNDFDEKKLMKTCRKDQILP